MGRTDTTTDVRTLDVRDIDGEPFGAITSALEELPDGESLRLVNSFDPEPLYDVLERRNYAFETSRVAADEWHVTITRQ